MVGPWGPFSGPGAVVELSWLPKGSQLRASRCAKREARITSRSRAAAPPGEKRRTRRRTRNEDREARSANNFAPSWEPLFPQPVALPILVRPQIYKGSHEGAKLFALRGPRSSSSSSSSSSPLGGAAAREREVIRASRFAQREARSWEPLQRGTGEQAEQDENQNENKTRSTV